MKSRTESLQIATLSEFDLLIIGGGIAGAGIAQNAASRGLSVCLIEREDFASGTSSRTTKLIHGGLRYLEQFHFNLCRQLARERAVLERLAPHMVRDFSFVLPTYRSNRWFNLKAQLGLALYDFLAMTSGAEHHFQRMSASAVTEAAPALSARDLDGGLRFHDAITDDSRIVLSVVKSACQQGAVAINYVEARGFVTERGQITGVVCHDRYSGQEFVVKSKVCVNATGVWTDRVVKLADDHWRNRVKPSKGIHLIVPPSAFETNVALFLPTPDRRYVFVVPWQRALMIGTTDEAYDGDLSNPLPTGDEIDYLLSIVNSYTQTHRLNRSDITATFAGLRPLVQFEQSLDSNSTSGMSREHLIFEASGGLINVAGGKLTSYRLMAEEVMEKVLVNLPDRASNVAKTETMMLGGWSDKQDFLTQTMSISAAARKLSMEPATIDHLIESYGADAAKIVEIVEASPALSERIMSDFPHIFAEVVYCANYEMAACLQDVLMRRMRLGILNQRQCLEAAPAVAKLMQKVLGWDDYRTKLELSILDEDLSAHLSPIDAAFSQTAQVSAGS